MIIAGFSPNLPCVFFLFSCSCATCNLATLSPHFSLSLSLHPLAPFQTNSTPKSPNWRKASAAAALHATASFSARRCCSSPPSFCPSDRGGGGGGGDASCIAGPALPSLQHLPPLWLPHPRPKGFASEDGRPITATIKTDADQTSIK